MLTLPGEFPTEPTIEHRPQLLRALTELAEHCISIEGTQTATEILAFLLSQNDLEMDTFDRANDLFADLAADMDLASMIEYLREVFPPERS